MTKPTPTVESVITFAKMRFQNLQNTKTKDEAFSIALTEALQTQQDQAVAKAVEAERERIKKVVDEIDDDIMITLAPALRKIYKALTPPNKL